MREHCAQCLSPLVGFGRETPKHEIVCGPCFAAIWGGNGNGQLAPTSGRRERGNARPGRWWRMKV
jgi:hypothetical protein